MQKIITAMVLTLVLMSLSRAELLEFKLLKSLGSTRKLLIERNEIVGVIEGTPMGNKGVDEHFPLHLGPIQPIEKGTQLNDDSFSTLILKGSGNQGRILVVLEETYDTVSKRLKSPSFDPKP